MTIARNTNRPTPLTVWAGPQMFTFPAGRIVTVGRADDADVRVSSTHKQALSRRHLILHHDGTQWLASDKSRNGIFVDGRRLTTVAIDDDTAITLGGPDGPTLTFRVTTQGVPAARAPPATQAAGAQPPNPLIAGFAPPGAAAEHTASRRSRRAPLCATPTPTRPTNATGPARRPTTTPISRAPSATRPAAATDRIDRRRQTHDSTSSHTATRRDQHRAILLGHRRRRRPVGVASACHRRVRSDWSGDP